MDSAEQNNVPGAKPSISAIVPVRDGASYLNESLPAIREALAPLDGEVLVVDDGSSDGSGDVARRFGVRVLETGGPVGAARARNLGAEHAGGEVLVFVDADITPNPGTVPGLLAHLESPGYSAAFGSYDPRFPGSSFASRYMNLRHHFYHRHGRLEADSFWCGLGVIRRRAFMEVGGFDPAYEGIEDVELGVRLKQAGHRIRLDPDCRGAHLKGWTLRQVLYTDVFKRALPWSRLLNRRDTVPPTLNTGVPERVRAIGAVLLLLSAVLTAVGQLSVAAPATIGLAVAVANRRFARFMAWREGAGFAVGALLYHQLYYLYSTAVYAYCKGEAFLGHVSGNRGPERASELRS